MKSQRFGIEIEITGLTREKAAQVAAEYFGTAASYLGQGYSTWGVKDSQGRTWKFMSDASIHVESKSDQPAEAVELVSPICVYEDISTIQELIRKLRASGAISNSSCGIHVHIDASPHTANSLRNLTNIMASKETLIYKALNVHVSRERDYCRKVDYRFLEELNAKKPQTLDEVKNIWYNGRDGSGQHYDASRYHCLNLHAVFNKGTVEWRLFNGTTHAGKIKAYIQLCLAISHQALSQRYASRTVTQSSNEKYTFRTWLLRLGMIGDEFKTARLHLLEKLDGSIAWKDPAQAIAQRERLRERNERAIAEEQEAQQQPEAAAENYDMEQTEDEQDLGFSMSM